MRRIPGRGWSTPALASWKNLVSTRTGMYGDLPDITSYEEDIDGDTAVVTYGFEVSELDQSDER